jgi:hypothetical protein
VASITGSLPAPKKSALIAEIVARIAPISSGEAEAAEEGAAAATE